MIAPPLDFPFLWLAGVSFRVSVAVVLFITLRPWLRRLIGSQGVAGIWLVLALSFVLPWPRTIQWNLPLERTAFGNRVVPLAVPPSPKPVPLNPDKSLALPGSRLANLRPPTVGIVTTPMRNHRAWNGWSVLWLTGALLGLMRLAYRWHQTRRWISLTTPVQPDSTLAEVFNTIPLIWRRGVELRLADELEIPALASVFRPRICVPRSWCQRLDTKELRHILLHELGHVRRRDLAVQWFWAFVCCLHWFDPLVWLAAWLARADRELACDAWVLTRGGDETFAERYGATLIKAVQWVSEGANPSSMVVVAMVASKGQLTRRVRAIGSFRPLPIWRTNAAALTMMIVATAFSTVRVFSAPAEAPSIDLKPDGFTVQPVKINTSVANAPMVIDARFVSMTPEALERVKAALLAGNLSKNDADAARILSYIASDKEPKSVAASKSSLDLQMSALLMPQQSQRLFAFLETLPREAVTVSPPTQAAVNPGQPASFGLTHPVRYPRRWEKNEDATGYVLAESGLADLGITWRASVLPQVPDLGVELKVSCEESFLEDPSVLLPLKPGETPHISNFGSRHSEPTTMDPFAGTTVMTCCKASLPPELIGSRPATPPQERWLLGFFTPHQATAAPKAKVEVKSEYFAIKQATIEKLAQQSGLSNEETELFRRVAENFAFWKAHRATRAFSPMTVKPADVEKILDRLRRQTDIAHMPLSRSTITPEQSIVASLAEFTYPTAFNSAAGGTVTGEDFKRQEVGMSVGVDLRRPTSHDEHDAQIICRHVELTNVGDFRPPTTGTSPSALTPAQPITHSQDASTPMKVPDGATVILSGIVREPGAWDGFDEAVSERDRYAALAEATPAPAATIPTAVDTETWPGINRRPTAEAQMFIVFVTLRNVLVAAPADYAGNEEAWSSLYTETLAADSPYALPTAGQPGLVANPYAPDSGLVDVRGLNRGTPIQDPFTGKMFLVP